MTDVAIKAQDLKEILLFIAGRIASEEARLNALDGAIGDGDHGITMRIGFQAVAAKLAGLDAGAGIETLLRESGKEFMGATGGAIGVILGKALMAGGKALAQVDAIRAAEFKMLLDAMSKSVETTGKAKRGDKTILDAIISAHEALAADPVDSGNLLEAAATAAAAAEAGAQQTAQMVCRLGRASRLGERTLGHPDPGAVSFSIILRALADWLKQKSDESPASERKTESEFVS